MRVVALLLVALALVMVATAESGFDRSNDPFMRLASKVDSALIENSAKATVAHASRLARRDDPAEESTEEAAEETTEETAEDGAAEESTEETAEDATEEAAAEDATEETAAEDGAAEETAEESAEDGAEDGAADVTQELADEAAKAKADEAAAKAKADGLAQTVAADENKLQDDAAKIAEANSRADAAQNSASAAQTATEAKAQQELEAVRAQAEAQAKQTIEAATAQAKEMVDKAKAASIDSCASGNCAAKSEAEIAKKKEWREVVLLKPAGGNAAGELNDQALGLAPVMSVDTPTIRHAELVATKADDFHDKFIDKHEKDCQGSVCPLGNFRVGAAL